MFSLKDKIFVITGATRGLGKEFVDCLSKVTDINSIIVLDLPQNIIDLNINNNIYYFPMDLRDVCSIQKAFKNIKNSFGQIDVLINNAGVNKLISALSVTEDIWDSIIDVNLKGTFFACKEAFPCLVQSNDGCIINIASQYSIVGGKYRCPYAASKAGIVSITKTLALEWAGHGIRVNAISPTISVKSSNENLLELPTVKEELLKNIPLGRFCTSKDIIGAIIYLASSEAAMVTGHNLLIDGGWTV
jgi:2-deoxy-D-gluconate 3-dehydrogenase